jgi:hypothetical protein
MELQQKMFSEIELWMDSGLSKSSFLAEKNYSEAKFNYWLSKWKSKEQLVSSEAFKELHFSEFKTGKVLEIQLPHNIKISIFG